MNFIPISQKSVSNLLAHLAVITIILVCLSGCSTINEWTDSIGDQFSSTSTDDPDPDRIRVGLVPQPRLAIKDLPVPLGFELIDEQSRTYYLGKNRIIDHIYEGKGTRGDADRFYRQQMLIKGWVKRGDKTIHGKSVLLFEKKSEFCEVTIHQKSRTFGGHTATIQISVQPLDRKVTGR